MCMYVYIYIYVCKHSMYIYIYRINYVISWWFHGDFMDVIKPYNHMCIYIYVHDAHQTWACLWKLKYIAFWGTSPSLIGKSFNWMGHSYLAPLQGYWLICSASFKPLKKSLGNCYNIPKKSFLCFWKSIIIPITIIVISIGTLFSCFFATMSQPCSMDFRSHHSSDSASAPVTVHIFTY